MHNSTIDFQLEQAIGMQVNRTAFLMTEEIAKRFSQHGYGLSAQDFGILFRLSQQQPMTQVDIAAVMMRDKTTITRRIDSLDKKGLVARAANPDDRRCFHIKLTSQGTTALEVLIPLVRDFQHEVQRDVSEEDKMITMQTLQRISNTLIEMKTTGVKK
jgi:MarR family transcriptional regulator for hemolysin